MVKIFSQRHFLEYRWEAVTCALFLKYPNPFSRHVITTDVIERSLDPSTGVLHTKRLLQKMGKIPLWITKLIPATITNKALVIEESFVDTGRGRMSVCTRNLSYRGWLTVEERQEFVREDNLWTLADVQVKVVGGEKALALGKFIVNRIERFSIKKYKDQLCKSRQALLYVLEQMKLNEIIKN